ncbi:MAG: NAD-dependent epimerase/dehydratase family protein [Candidatus Cloacimonadaceae bacterium]|nr:NAD-dependent epimerase/dehydratase family protein [Candidatus Cloacimonadaceae bacterium]MDP3115048.1 NAD-dependent epimerase/dehydratase family protein [Candidatus Cloacimonadaceae bacterium]
MKIAVTGANGFLGSNIANYFLDQGHEICALMRMQGDAALIDPRVSIVKIDYDDHQALQTAFADRDIVIHNAGKTRTLTFNQMIEANVTTTRAVLNAVNACPGIKQFIFISSQSASRPSLSGELITETDLPAPVTWYGRSKLLAERMIQTHCAIAWTIIRPVPVYGGGDRDFLKLFKALKNGIDLQIGFKERGVNMIYMTELLDFVNLCIDNPKAFREIFFASDGKVYHQSQISTYIAHIMKIETIRIPLPDPLAKAIFHVGEILSRVRRKPTVVGVQKMKEVMAPNWTCSIDKAKRLLGWEPIPRLKENLLETYQWYQKHGWL